MHLKYFYEVNKNGKYFIADKIFDIDTTYISNAKFEIYIVQKIWNIHCINLGQILESGGGYVIFFRDVALRKSAML